MKKFFLIFKNNWENIRKLRIVFVLLSLIVILFSTSFTLFWEFNRQFRFNIEKSHLNSANFDFMKRYEKKTSSSRNAFCTAFKTIYDDHKKTKRRLSILTFGGKEGCFEALDVNQFVFTFKFADEFQPLTKARRIISIADIHIPEQLLKINYQSRFYQASIHGLLMKKFTETKDEKFLEHAKYLERYFFFDYIKYYSGKLREYLNEKLLREPIYTTLVKQKSTYQEFYRHFANPIPKILSERAIADITGKIIYDLRDLNKKQPNKRFQSENDFITARRKTKLFVDRVQKLKNFDENVWQQIYQINFQTLITDVVDYTVNYLPKNDGDLITFAYKKTGLLWEKLPFRDPYVPRWDLDFNDSLFLQQKNLNLILKIIQSSIENKNNFLNKNRQNSYFLNLSKYLFARLYRAKALLIDLLNAVLPGFKMYRKIKFAATKQNYGITREEQLRYFNFNEQTISELWKKKQFIFQSNNYLLTLLNQIKQRYWAWKKITFFQTNQIELQSLETLFFNDKTRSNKIIATLKKQNFDPLSVQTLLNNYFWDLTTQMLNKKRTYLELNKFFGVIKADFNHDQTAFQTFQTLLTTDFSLNQTLIETLINPVAFFRKWKQFVNQLKTISDKIIARILSAQGSRAWLIADDGLALKTPAEVQKAAKLFQQIVDPAQTRFDQWQFFKNYIALRLIKQANLSNPQTSTVEIGQAAYFSWSKLLEDTLFQKHFRRFYFGLNNLTDSEFTTFLTDLEGLKQTNFTLTKELLLSAAKENLKSTRKDWYFRFSYEEQSYGKPFSQFVEELEAGKIDNSIKSYGAYLLARLYFWLFVPDWEYAVTQNFPHFKTVNYFHFVDQIQNLVLATLNSTPTTEPISQIQGNIIKIQTYYQKLLKHDLTLINQDPAKKLLTFFENEKPLLVDRLTTLQTINALKTSLIVDNVKISDLEIDFQTFAVPELLKYWAEVFMREEQIFPVVRLDQAVKEQIINQVLQQSPFEIFETTPHLLKSQTDRQVPYLNSIIFTYNAFFEQFNRYFSDTLKSLLPTAFRTKFTVNVLDNDKNFGISYSPFQIHKPFVRLANLKREFRNQYFLVSFETDVNFNIVKRLNAAFQTTSEFIKKQFNDQLASLEYNWITDIENWKITEGLYKTFPNAYLKTPLFGNEIYSASLLKAEKNWNEIIAFLFEINLQPLKFLYFQNSKTNETFLLISKSDVKLFLHEGYEPQLANEIVISPLYAKYKKISVGDYVSFIGIDNFKISGIGTSNKFVYPALNYVDLIPRQDSNIIYVNQSLFDSNLIENLKKSVASNFWFTNEYFFYKQNDDLSINVKTKNYRNLFGYSSNTAFSETQITNQAPNYTTFLETLYPDYDVKGKQYLIKDQQFANLRAVQSIIPFALNTLIPRTIYQIVFYVFLYIVIILGLIVIFAIVHLFSKKIEINRWQFGILKALGFGNWYILLSLISFAIFLIFSTFIGWVFGTILQQPFFTLFTDKILFTFNYFYFNYQALYLCLGLFVLFLILALIYYNFRTFNRLSVIRFMSQSSLATRKHSEKLFASWIKKRIMNPFWKINYILFDTIGKKIFFLFAIVLLIAANFIGVILFVSAFYKTEQQLQTDQKVKWIFQYRSPIRGHPISKLYFFTNRGAEAVWNKADDDVTPTQNLTGEAYLLQKDQTFKQQKMNLTEILSYLQVLHNKSINYKKIVKLLKEGQDNTASNNQEDFKRYVCNIVKNIFEREEIDNVNCLEDILGRAIPFTEFPDAQKERQAKEHFPISFNGVAYHPEKDQLHTLMRTNIFNNEEKFDLHGLAANNRFLDLNPQLAKRFYLPSSATKQKVIPLIVNQLFADRIKKKVGDRFGLEVNYQQAVLYDDISKKNILLKDSDWNYYWQPSDGSEMVKKPYSELPYDVQFYHGSFLINANKNLTTPDKYRIKTVEKGEVSLKIMEWFDPVVKKWVNYEPYYRTQRNGQTEYVKYVNVDNITLEIGEYVYYPFRFTKESAERIRKDSNIKVWFANGKFKILDQKMLLQHPDTTPYQFEIIHVYPSFDQAEAYVSQSFLNKLIWNNASKTNKYRESGTTINPLTYFNVRFSPTLTTYEALYNFGLINGLRYIDFSSISSGRKPMIFKLRNIGLERKYRIAFLRFGFKIIWILVLFNLLTLVFLFGLMTKIIFDIFQNNTLLLRILGYSNLEISTQIFVIMLTPIVLAFLIASFVIKTLIDEFLSYLITSYQIYIFYIADAWIFFACFAFFFLLWLGIYFFYIRAIKQTNLANRLKNL